jgi:hypothetical protein
MIVRSEDEVATGKEEKGKLTHKGGEERTRTYDDTVSYSRTEERCERSFSFREALSCHVEAGVREAISRNVRNDFERSGKSRAVRALGFL